MTTKKAVPVKVAIFNGVRVFERNGQPVTSVRLTDPEMTDSMDALKARLQGDPAFGQRLLRRAGIVNNAGHVTKKYAGVF